MTAFITTCRQCASRVSPHTMPSCAARGAPVPAAAQPHLTLIDARSAAVGEIILCLLGRPT
jgi:hypothetical protein